MPEDRPSSPGFKIWMGLKRTPQEWDIPKQEIRTAKKGKMASTRSLENENTREKQISGRCREVLVRTVDRWTNTV